MRLSAVSVSMTGRLNSIVTVAPAEGTSEAFTVLGIGAGRTAGTGLSSAIGLPFEADCTLDAVEICERLRIDHFELTEAAEIGRLVVDAVVLDRRALQQRHREPDAHLVLDVHDHAINRS